MARVGQFAWIGNRTYQGDGTSGVYIWGAMLEQGSYSTSYIPTNGSTVTRSAETANGSGDAATFNDSEGVLMVEVLRPVSGLATISLSNNTSQNHVSLLFRTNSTEVWMQMSGNGTESNIFLYDVKQSDNNKISLLYSTGLMKIFVNGFLKGSTSISALPVGLSNIKYSRGDNGEKFYGNTKQIQYYNSALTDSELEQLTSWTSFTDMAEGQLYTIE